MKLGLAVQIICSLFASLIAVSLSHYCQVCWCFLLLCVENGSWDVWIDCRVSWATLSRLVWRQRTNYVGACCCWEPAYLYLNNCILCKPGLLYYNLVILIFCICLLRKRMLSDKWHGLDGCPSCPPAYSVEALMETALTHTSGLTSSFLHPSLWTPDGRGICFYCSFVLAYRRQSLLAAECSSLLNDPTWGWGTPFPVFFLSCPLTSLFLPRLLFPFVFFVALLTFFFCPSLPFLPE